ncbi:MAG: PQQ-dependent sugar dehydrogenase [Actinomycetota bacterium]|nr:PQQ-dependent sugar dehydrogenase [Actinomycetota bacterium]
MTLIATFAFLVALLPIAALAPGGTFTDDDGIVHEGGIEAIAAEQITVGCNPPFNDRFCPDRVLTRAEMATMVSRALSLPATTIDHFNDDNGHILEGAINRIAEAGITLGCNPPANDRFCPDRNLTRAEAAGFLARALGLPASTTNFFADDDGHVLEGAINRIADAGITVGCNPPANSNFCPNRILTRGEMATMLTRALSLTSMRPPARPALDWDLVVGGLSGPIQALVPPGEARILIAELGGAIRVFENGALRPQPFLDLTDTVVTGGERGLLSIAIHPDYPTDRRLFAWYSAPLQQGGSGDHTTYIVEFDIAADLQTASSPRTVLAVDQPFANHNGGFVDFGPDGYLYLSLGDGGSGNDPGARARNLNTLLGKMIRIDVDGAAPYVIPADNPYVGEPGRDEIWASGLRNPWRWSIDNGNMYIGDVGQGAREEVDAVAVSPTGYDFGWSRYEGTLCNPNDTDASCSTGGLTMPVVEYGRSVGSTVTGGVVYRGPTVRSLSQYYIYSDFGSGIVRAFRLLNGRAVEAWDLSSALREPGLVSFGFDSNGEILAVSLFDNAVYRLVGG